jgi:hypothetical protein
MNPLQDWLAALLRDLGLDDALDMRLLLELSREVAHAVERPAAPLTTYVLGLAVAREPAGGRTAAELAERVSALVGTWSHEPPGEPS